MGFNHTPNFSTIRLAVSAIWKRGTSAHAHVQMYPTLDFCKRLANGFLTTHQISAQSVQPLPRYGKGTHLHVRTCARADVSTTPMTWLVCIAAWSLNTYQIWSQSIQLFLSYSLATIFDTLHAARATYQGDPQMSQHRLLSR